ncbi:response regulator [candidate division KSB1 bacterium]|nr:response regulator [candidate division KSB1 bacterium]
MSTNNIKEEQIEFLLDSSDYTLIDVNIRLNELIENISTRKKQIEDFNRTLIQQLQYQNSEISWRNYALDRIDNAVVLINRNRTIIYQNKAAERLFNRKNGEKIQKKYIGSHLDLAKWSGKDYSEEVLLEDNNRDYKILLQAMPPDHLIVIGTEQPLNDAQASNEITNDQKSNPTNESMNTKKQNIDNVILHIDDDKNILDIVRLMLRNHEFRLINTIDGTKAMELTLQYRPKLILLDIMMPEINGFELIQKFKSTPKTKDIPIVILSVSDSADRCLELGADKYLTKPIEEAQLIETIYALITSSK